MTHVYMDLGVSSMQIDTPERGFSYSYDAPLDMRMDPTLRTDRRRTSSTPGPKRRWPSFSAATARSGTPAGSRGRSSLADRARPYTRTSELVDTIKDAIPTPARFAAGNPARRVFQALRIEVNGELESLLGRCRWPSICWRAGECWR